jgi:Fe-S-cluster-containing dehydrogenase component
MDPVKKNAFKCDLCGGDPQCVKWCANTALKYVGLAEMKALGYQQDFWQPYTKDFGPDLVPFEGYKVTFENAYPDLAGQK